MQRTPPTRKRRDVAGLPTRALLPLVVLLTFLAWSLRVAFVNFEILADLTFDSLLNEALRTVVFIGPFLLYAERAPVLTFLKTTKPRRNAAWL